MKSFPRAVSRIGAVSPSPLATASMMAVKIPAPAVGTTIRRITLHRGTPRANAPSRSSCGTNRRTSSAALAMIGHINTVSAMPPASAEKLPSVTTTSTQMKAPATMDGVESRISATKRTDLATRPRPYSER